MVHLDILRTTRAIGVQDDVGAVEGTEHGCIRSYGLMTKFIQL